VLCLSERRSRSDSLSLRERHHTDVGFAGIHGGLQSGRRHDAREIYLLQDQDDDNSTGKICVAKGIGNAVHYGFLAGNILVGMDIPPGFPGGLFQQDFLSPLCFPGWSGGTQYALFDSRIRPESRQASLF